jgi:hypothetical protein
MTKARERQGEVVESEEGRAMCIFYMVNYGKGETYLDHNHTHTSK